MELRHLRYFVAVAEELSFRRAADRLHVSHPALSQQVGDLEDELGFKLFERNSRHVKLTEVGRAFLTGSRRTLAAAKQAIALAQEVAHGESGRLLIGSVGAVTGSFLPHALAQFRAKHPMIETTVLNLSDLFQAVSDDTVMLGIGLLSDNLDRADLSIEPLLRSAIGIVCSKSRRLPKRKMLKLKDFRDEKFLGFDPKYSSFYNPFFRNLCRRVGGFEPEIEAIADSPESMLGMVAAGRGIFLGPQIGMHNRTNAVDFHVLHGLENAYELNAIWKTQSKVAPTIGKFVAALHESLKDFEALP
jgi:DNA-binding transcriptional LysR family regulator